MLWDDLCNITSGIFQRTYPSWNAERVAFGKNFINMPICFIGNMFGQSGGIS